MIMMTKEKMEKVRQIYDLMNGSLNLEEYPELNIPYVKNEFEEGAVCEQLYKEAFEAKERLQERLGVAGKEDKDVEIIFNSLEDIGRILTMKMYEYGYKNGLENQ